MSNSTGKPLISGQMQLNIIGVLLVALLALSAWVVLHHPWSWSSLIPLSMIGYTAWRVVYELTWNRKNVPTLATGFAGRRHIADLLKREAAASVKKPYTIIDLGSGRGELTRYIASTIPDAKVIGIEMMKIPFWQSVLVQRVLGPQNLSYRRLDFWPYDCSNVDAVVFYLSGPFARRVGEKLWKEMRPGGLVVSHSFALLPPWEPAEILQFRSPFKETVYVYRKS